MPTPGTDRRTSLLTTLAQSHRQAEEQARRDCYHINSVRSEDPLGSGIAQGRGSTDEHWRWPKLRSTVGTACPPATYDRSSLAQTDACRAVPMKRRRRPSGLPSATPLSAPQIPFCPGLHHFNTILRICASWSKISNQTEPPDSPPFPFPTPQVSPASA
jgi:hypothetical protein